MKVLENIAADL